MDKFLDQITKVAANICDVPISLINLISKDTLLAKSSYGIDIIEVPREITFCNHTIKSNDLFQVKDATKDDRFRDNPFVLNDPKLRFYAGVALVTPRGHRIGTFCLIDIKSNQLKDHQREALHSLARSVIAHFEQNLLNKKILDQSHQFQLVQNISKTGYWELDLQTEETFWSDEVFNIYGISEKSQKNKDTGIKHYSEGDQKKFEQISGYSRNELLGSNHRIINSGTHPKEFFEDMWSTISQGEQWGGEICNRNKDGDLYWVYTVIFPVMFENEISAYYSLRVDITEQKKMEESLADEREKNVHASQLAAIGEISAGIGHEISNPLTVLSANIELLSRLEMPPEKKEKAFGQMAKSVNRINKIVKGLHHLAQGSRKDERSLHNLQDVFSNTLEFCEEAL